MPKTQRLFPVADGVEATQQAPRRWRTELFDNIDSAIFSDGRIVGGWSVTSDGEVVTELFEDIGSGATGAVHKEAERLTLLLDASPIVPSFPTPTEKRLRGRA